MKELGFYLAKPYIPKQLKKLSKELSEGIKNVRGVEAAWVTSKNKNKNIQNNHDVESVPRVNLAKINVL